MGVGREKEEITLGSKAPNFTLKDKDGVEHSLKSFLKENEFIILFFYPRDNTPGCTIEARQMTKHLKHFKELNALPVGISGGDEKSKTKFCQKQKIEVPMLSDSDYSVSQKYGVYGNKSFMGKIFKGISRQSFLISADGKVQKVYHKVKPALHSLEVLDDIRALTK